MIIPRITIDTPQGTVPPVIAKLQDPALLNELINAAMIQALVYLQSLTPGSGPVRDAWVLEVEIGADEFIDKALMVNTYGPTPDVIWYINDGTVEHDVVAVNAKSLRFLDKEGNVVFRKKVHIPAHAGNYMLEATEVQTLTVISDDLEAALISALQSL